MLSLSGLVLLLAAHPAHAGDGQITSNSSATADYYEIQPGDTLWSISTRFLNDPYAWPQLWSLNEYITNPHWIYPGNRIYFRLQDHLTPPSATPEVVPVEPVRVAQAAPADACDFPTRFAESRPATPMTAPGVIGKDDEMNLRGTIRAADEPGSLLGAPSYVYLDIDDGDVKCGDNFSILRRVQKKVKARGEVVGSMYRVLGEVQVIRTDGNVATAKIRDSYSEMVRGDLVGDLIPVSLTVDIRPPADDLQAEVYARLTSDEQILSNINETVFLDRGTDDGVDVGDALYIVERRDPLSPATDLEDEALPERVIGRVVVVRATAEASTAVVVNAARDIQVGQRLTTRPNKSEDSE